MPILRCLFCNHVNPATASFCNDCGSQLDLQPCGQCGAVDSRNAKSCHKCGTPFPSHLSSAFEELLAPKARGVQPRPSADRQLTVGPLASSLPMPTEPPRSNWLVPGVAVLLVAAAATFAIFYRRPVAPVPAQAVQQVAPSIAETPTAPAEPPPTALPAPPVQAAQAEPVPLPKEQPVVPAIVMGSAEKGPARISPRTAAAPIMPALPVAEAQPTVRREPPAIKDCSQAVATLGLCNP